MRDSIIVLNIHDIFNPIVVSLMNNEQKLIAAKAYQTSIVVLKQATT